MGAVTDRSTCLDDPAHLDRALAREQLRCLRARRRTLEIETMRHALNLTFGVAGLALFVAGSFLLLLTGALAYVLVAATGSSAVISCVHGRGRSSSPAS
jgi:hypothetical protein